MMLLFGYFFITAGKVRSVRLNGNACQTFLSKNSEVWLSATSKVAFLINLYSPLKRIYFEQFRERVKPMLSYKLLKNHGGIMLIGDYGTLKVLHEVIHDVNERSPLIRDVKGLFIGLAYDVRKAFERQREIIEPPRNFEEQGVQYGVKILWPVLLAQHRILRTSLAFIDSGKKHQAITYAV